MAAILKFEVADMQWFVDYCNNIPSNSIMEAVCFIISRSGLCSGISSNVEIVHMRHVKPKIVTE